ncbi:MAG: ethanolamine ammonia-lyase reactivating factor EutA [Pseudomonadota bacterium]
MKEYILSVGIDIGTTTTQIIFSRFTIENTASLRSVPQVKIVDKEIVYRSSVYFTPLIPPAIIDGAEIRRIIDLEYEKANIKPGDVDTGAVIITGETARKENAEEIVRTLSGLAGDFVVATSGPALEGIIAGKGAKADQISKEKGCVIANFDIGGGTTNIAVFKNGEVIDTACLDIGGRLLQLDKDSLKVTYVSKKLKALAHSIGMEVEPGSTMNLSAVKQITSRMAGILEEVIGIKPVSMQLESIITDHDLRRDYSIDYISFSGGVADCIYSTNGRTMFQYGDIGVVLGNTIRGSLLFKEMNVLEPDETIRATVIGAGSHTTEISGSTITYSESVLPLRNVPILKLSESDVKLSSKELSKVIADKFSLLSGKDKKQFGALALKGAKNANFREIQELAHCIIEGIKENLLEDFPLVVIVENDIAKALGQALRTALQYKKDVVCIDSIKVENGDYIDIGSPFANGTVVPVVVKTLFFDY